MLFISGILTLGFIALVAWGIWTYVNDPSKIKNIIKNVTDFTGNEEPKVKKQEEYKPSQEEIIRNIVKDEIERMGSKIIRSIPQPTSINQNEIINEIRYNRQLLERIMVSLDKKREPISPEPVKPKFTQYPITKFARMVDNSLPLGFRIESLSDISKGACYQIIINSDVQACYRLITDLTIQREIIAMFNPIITTGCEYEEEPTAINEIIHIEDGLLELHSGVWHIVKKAKIRFI